MGKPQPSSSSISLEQSTPLLGNRTPQNKNFTRLRLFFLYLSGSGLTYKTLKMSAQNSAGIQTLLEAEKDASKIVQKAREYRTKRVKEARDEAKKEIEEYKAKKEEEYKKFEAEHSQGNKKAEEDANKEAEEKIKEIKELGKKSQDKVIKDLLSAVFDVKAEPPTASA